MTGPGDHDRPLFTVAGREVVRLSMNDAPVLQRLLERCGDYYAMVEGRPAGPNAAIEELTEGPPERVPHDLFALGIAGAWIRRARGPPAS